MKSFIPGIIVAALTATAIIPTATGGQHVDPITPTAPIAQELDARFGLPMDDAPLAVFANYDQDWHNGHDEMIKRVVAEFNAANGWYEGHEHELDANVVKAWALQESGSHQEIFTAGDMMQMNNNGDWAPEKEWFGVYKGQKLSPEESLRGALAWAFMKGEETRPQGDNGIDAGWRQATRGDDVVDGYESRFTGWDRALTRYNGGGVPDYLGDIERRLAATS